MLKRISDLAGLMREKKILHCEVKGYAIKNGLGFRENHDFKLTLDPSSLYQQEEAEVKKPKEEFTASDDYDEFLFKNKELNEAKVRSEIENL